MKPLLLRALLASLCLSLADAGHFQDRIVDLPGLPYDLPFQQYSGYLHGGTENNSTNNIFYWLTEYQFADGDDVPLILWLNGGPGCSSLGGLLTELGPFHANKEGQTLFENVHSWNKAGHVIYMESPPGVGFSFADNFTTTWDDDSTSQLNMMALNDFFKKYPEHANRQFFITGESYGGVYLPTLAARLIDAIEAGTFNNPNFRGVAIGNGYMDQKRLYNSAVNYYYGHGIIGDTMFGEVKKACCASHVADTDGDGCDYYTPLMDSVNVLQPSTSACANYSYLAGMAVPSMIPDPYNIYQSCYSSANLFHMIKHAFDPIMMKVFSKTAEMMDKSAATVSRTNPNYDSTDHIGGFACFGDYSNREYLRLPAVQTALHVDPRWIQKKGGAWSDCSSLKYTNIYKSLHAQFDRMVKPFTPKGATYSRQLRLMTYNGDVDVVCNFLGDEWFGHAVVERNGVPLMKRRQPWHYAGQLAGSVQQFRNFDIITVNGAGHFVPMDRAGPALQMIYNFVNNRPYSMMTDIDVNPKPYQVTKHPDEITNLSGIPWKLPFRHFSGYLDGGVLADGAKNNLFYWFTQYQLPDHAGVPVILWLNGGPGCSSLGGLFTELGPFYPNADGNTMFENVHSWNKIGHVIYMESPSGVGFSYNDNFNLRWNDDDVAQMNANALHDFFKSKFPHLANRPLFITGESYAGIYLPTLAEVIVKRIVNGTFSNTNFKGFAVGNGILDGDKNFNSVINYGYYHGLFGQNDWKNLKRDCCGSPTANGVTCDFYGKYYAAGGNAACRRTLPGVYNQIYTTPDPYNIYQSCYANNAMKSLLDVLPVGQTEKLSSLFTKTDYNSTNHLGGFACNGNPQGYLSRPDIQKMIHVSPKWQKHKNYKWSDCSGLQYTSLYANVHKQFDFLLQPFTPKGTNCINHLRLMIYNGEVDTVCNFLGDEWFGHEIVKRNGLQLTRKRGAWTYRSQLAGSQQKFGNFHIVTVNGAGHFVPMDRSGPALQMIYNFIHDATSYSEKTYLDLRAVPYNPMANPAPKHKQTLS